MQKMFFELNKQTFINEFHYLEKATDFDPMHKEKLVSNHFEMIANFNLLFLLLNFLLPDQ